MAGSLHYQGFTKGEWHHIELEYIQGEGSKCTAIFRFGDIQYDDIHREYECPSFTESEIYLFAGGATSDEYYGKMKNLSFEWW